jgi:hypothetical protein
MSVPLSLPTEIKDLGYFKPLPLGSTRLFRPKPLLCAPQVSGQNQTQGCYPFLVMIIDQSCCENTRRPSSQTRTGSDCGRCFLDRAPFQGRDGDESSCDLLEQAVLISSRLFLALGCRRSLLLVVFWL